MATNSQIKEDERVFLLEYRETRVGGGVHTGTETTVGWEDGSFDVTHSISFRVHLFKRDVG